METPSDGARVQPRLTRRRLLLIAGAVATGGYGIDRLIDAQFGRSPGPVHPVVSVRAMGAKGDGYVNDTSAFQRACAAINAARGGTLLIPGGTYVVGRQHLAGRSGLGFAYRGEPVIAIADCNRPVLVDGRGATLRTAPGLKLGAFNPITGAPHEPTSLPFLEPDYRSDIYEGALNLQRNARVWVRGLNVDGNAAEIEFGGQYGDAGYQVSHDGLVATRNRELLVQNAHFHHHGRDGLILRDPNRAADEAPRPVMLHTVSCDYNGRQGLSWVGGRGLQAKRCSFSFTGRASIPVSNPGAGVDIEPEDSTCRDAVFTECEFNANLTFGVIANVGDAARIGFERCTFATWPGSTVAPGPRAVWPNKPGMWFEQCRIHGSVVDAYGSDSAADACRFARCSFDDTSGGADGPPYVGIAIIETGGSNVRFDQCSVQATRSRSIALGHLAQAAPMIVQGCSIRHCDAVLPAGSYQASLQSVRLANTVFHESSLTNDYYIATSNVTIGGGVRVDGPHVAWERVGGQIGTIA